MSNQTQVTLSWGEPWRTNRTVNNNVTYDQWVYKNGSYVYFKNQILYAWQE